MTVPHATAIPTLLFGAFDRHNFGDLLFSHVAAALLPQRPLIFAGLAERDMGMYGGHQTRALAGLAAELRGQPLNILHVGGELLTCDAWQAAVMLLEEEPAQEVIARLDARPDERMAWAHGQLGLEARAPYSVARALFPQAAVIYCGVGGVELAQRPAPLQAEVLANLGAADAVGVRERQTQALLEAAGIAVRLMPDPAVMVAELFGGAIRQQGMAGEVASIRQAFPEGYIAVQFSADFGDDATLGIIAAQLDRFAAASGHGVVLFRAGAAPWHDDLACYRRLAARLRTAAVKVFTGLHLWDICALIAHSRAYCGSSLHGRIVAMAFGLPRVNLCHPVPANQPGKQVAYAAAWEAPGLPAMVGVDEMMQGLQQALAADAGQLRHMAGELAARYRREVTALCACLQ